VCGTDISSEAIRQARSRLEQAHVVDLDRDEVPFSPQSFDTLIYADILEHLKFPWTVVRAQRSLLRAGGRAFCSLPNVGHYRVVWQLLRQRWEYTTEGVFDYTHLRFFTRASLRAMFAGAGYQGPSIDPLYPPSRKVRAFNRLTLGRLHDLSVGAWWLEARSSSHSIGKWKQEP
jgi:2-polyprenyl-3-methyl-5-hydroxy-6-metoxy-1,4-benzoquinol methylase